MFFPLRMNTGCISIAVALEDPEGGSLHWSHSQPSTSCRTPIRIVEIISDLDINTSSQIHRRSQWSRGYHTRHWIRGSRVQNPAGVDGFFQSVKILNMTSFGREVKPRVPCRRFTARKRTWSQKLEPLSKICRTFHTLCRSDADDLRCLKVS